MTVVSNKPGIDSTSLGLFLVAGGLGLRAYTKRREWQSEAEMLSDYLPFAGAVLVWIAYDRWYDGVWPFEREDAPGRDRYGRFR